MELFVETANVPMNQAILSAETDNSEISNQQYPSGPSGNSYGIAESGNLNYFGEGVN